MICLVTLARATGTLQHLEWLFFDLFLRFRPPEPPSDRIVIVAIDSEYINTSGSYPIPSHDLATVIETINDFEPAVIGLNMLPDVLEDADHDRLLTVSQHSRSLIAAQRAFPPQIPALTAFESERVGFTDIIPDGDGHFRRVLLGMINPANPRDPDYLFSFTIRLVEMTLIHYDNQIDFGNGIRDPEAMRFGEVELPRFVPNTGGYINNGADGIQLLMNFRTGAEPFPIIPVQEVLSGHVDAELFRDRVVIIGLITPGLRPFISTAAVPTPASIHAPPDTLDAISGVEFQAHAVSQILSAILDDRPLLKTWSEPWEYAWIIFWGILSITISRFLHRSKRKLFVLLSSNVVLITMSYLAFLAGWWIPIAPIILVLNLKLILSSIYDYAYRYERAKTRLEERKYTIDRVFKTIHNGALQDLAHLIKCLHQDTPSKDQIVLKLEQINRRIRQVGEDLEQEYLNQEESLHLNDGKRLDLSLPIHELFYETYSETLQRNFSSFQSLKIRLRSFDPIDEQHITIQQKRRLCRFIEEAICNVGRHSENPTLLDVKGFHDQKHYILQIKDDGQGGLSNHLGTGTKTANQLATQLQGIFTRESRHPFGVICELKWPLKKH